MSDMNNEWNLSDGQIALLETIKPLSEWEFELDALYDNGNFDYIDETFWQRGRTIQYNDFYYAGVDQTPKVDVADPRVIELNYYRSTIFDSIPNCHYRDICDRAIKNFVIEKKSFETARGSLLDMINRFITPSIASYDYDTIREERKALNREIHEAMYHPDRIAKWLDAGNALEDYFQ